MKYIYRISLVFSIFCLCSIFLFKLLDKGLVAYSKSTYNKFYEMFTDTSKYDILFLGTSRTHRNIDVKICDSVLNLKTYNAGISGAGGYEIYSVAKGFLESHPSPKVIVLNIDPPIFDIKKGFFEPISYFHSLNNSKIYDALQRKDYPVILYKNIPFTRMMELNDDSKNNSIHGLSGKEDDYSNTYHGYLQMEDKVSKIDTVYKNGSVLAPHLENYQYIDSIVKLGEQKNIKFVLIIGPIYDHSYLKTYINYKDVKKIIANKYSSNPSVSIVYFDDLPLNNNRNYFFDNIHLNLSGTKTFSLILAQKLKELVGE